MKKILLLSMISVLIIPQITFASWWNPFSWGKSGVQEPPSRETSALETLPNPTVSDPVIPTPEPVAPKVIHDTRIIEKIVEKPVIQTITVQDPALQTQIASLISENISLKTQVASLLKSNKSLNTELASCENTPASSSSSANNNSEKIGMLNQIKSRLNPDATAYTEECLAGLREINNRVYKYNLLGGPHLDDYPVCGENLLRRTYGERLNILINSL